MSCRHLGQDEEVPQGCDDPAGGYEDGDEADEIIPASWARCPAAPGEGGDGHDQTAGNSSVRGNVQLSDLRQTGTHRCRGLFLGVVPPATLCHKEPARRIQNPLLGALERKIPPTRGYFACSSLVLYGTRLVGFHARKGPITGALMP